MVCNYLEHEVNGFHGYAHVFGRYFEDAGDFGRFDLEENVLQLPVLDSYECGKKNDQVAILFERARKLS